MQRPGGVKRLGVAWLRCVWPVHAMLGPYLPWLKKELSLDSWVRSTPAPYYYMFTPVPVVSLSYHMYGRLQRVDLVPLTKVDKVAACTLPSPDI